MRLDYAVEPAPPHLDCSPGITPELFSDAVDALWPRVKAQDPDVVTAWNDTLHKLEAILEQKSYKNYKQRKQDAIGCLNIMGNNYKDSRALDIVEKFRQRFINYMESDRFAEWLIARNTHPYASKPQGYELWWENGSALAGSGDAEVKEALDDYPSPSEQ